MKYQVLALIFFCSGLCSAAYAQKQMKPLSRVILPTASAPEAAVQAGRQMVRVPQKGIVSVSAAHLARLAAAQNRKYLQHQVLANAFPWVESPAVRHKIAAFDSHMLQSVVRLEETTPGLTGASTATGFFIETDWKGKKQIVGVTAAHVAEWLMDPRRAIIRLPNGKEKHFPLNIIAKGSSGMADVALFEVPENIVPLVRPLALASEEPEFNSLVRSYGYFAKDFRIVRNRVVQENTPNRLVTSMEFGSWNRSGACGGPVLNEQNEVVGVHCGSSDSRRESYAVPVSVLKELLAYANGKNKPQDLIFQGKKIGSINIDEYILSVQTKVSNRTLNSLTLWHQEKKVDYQRLEDLISLKYAAQIEFVIAKNGPESNVPVSKRLVVVDLATGEVISAALL